MNIASEFVRNVINRARRKSSAPNALLLAASTSDTERIAAIVAQHPGIGTTELAQRLGLADPGVLIGVAGSCLCENQPDGRWFLRHHINLDEWTTVLT